MILTPDSTERSKWRRHKLWSPAVRLLLIVSLIAAISAPSTQPAAATPDEEAQFVAALNQVRAGVGLPALTVNTELVALSRQHSQVMADAGRIFHGDPISAGFTGPWAKLGENVGIGANVQVLVDAFIASPGHYANIVDPEFSQVGVGVVWKDNALYTTHRFVQLPSTAPTTTQPAPPPPATTEPAPPSSTTQPAPPPSATDPSAPTTSITQPPITQPPTPTVAPPTTAPEPTTTTLPPPPAIVPERIIELIDMADLVGT